MGHTQISEIHLFIFRNDDNSITVQMLRHGKLLEQKIDLFQLSMMKKFAPDVYRFLLDPDGG